MDHLLFHKALHCPAQDSQQLDEYLELATNLETTHHIHTIPDSFTRTVGLLFSLVMEKQIDPWDLDLMRLVQLWEKEMNKREDIDFILAGNLVVWAWSVAKLRVEGALVATEPVEEDYYEEELGEVWEEWAPQADFVDLLTEGLEPPLDEKVRHKGQRKVTLMELLDSLEKARRYIRLRAHRSKARERLRKEQRVLRVAAGRTIAGRVHEDDAQTDTRQAWERLASLTATQNPIPFDQLVAGLDKEGLVRTFLALLFLADEQMVKLWQRKPPQGQIMVKRLVPLAARTEGGAAWLAGAPAAVEVEAPATMAATAPISTEAAPTSLAGAAPPGGPAVPAAVSEAALAPAVPSTASHPGEGRG